MNEWRAPILWQAGIGLRVWWWWWKKESIQKFEWVSIDSFTTRSRLDGTQLNGVNWLSLWIKRMSCLCCMCSLGAAEVEMENGNVMRASQMPTNLKYAWMESDKKREVDKVKFYYVRAVCYSGAHAHIHTYSNTRIPRNIRIEYFHIEKWKYWMTTTVSFCVLSSPWNLDDDNNNRFAADRNVHAEISVVNAIVVYVGADP